MAAGQRSVGYVRDRPESAGKWCDGQLCCKRLSRLECISIRPQVGGQNGCMDGRSHNTCMEDGWIEMDSMR